jgi:hypothetical protein
MSSALENLYASHSQDRMVFLPSQRKTPVDELTGLPYSIFFTPEDLDLPQNYHHSWHPENDSVLKGISGLALRMSRGQIAPEEMHRTGYHHFRDGFKGPAMLNDIDWKFQKMALGLTDALPRMAIDARTPGRYRILEISDDEHHFLSHPSRFHRENRFSGAAEDTGAAVIGQFIGLYAISQVRRDTLTESNLEKLRRTESTKTIMRLGRDALSQVLEEKVKAADDLYYLAAEQGMVTHFRTTPSREIAKIMPTGELAAYSFKLQEHLRETMEDDADKFEEEPALGFTNRGESDTIAA